MATRKKVTRKAASPAKKQAQTKKAGSARKKKAAPARKVKAAKPARTRTRGQSIVKTAAGKTTKKSAAPVRKSVKSSSVRKSAKTASRGKRPAVSVKDVGAKLAPAKIKSSRDVKERNLSAKKENNLSPSTTAKAVVSRPKEDLGNKPDVELASAERSEKAASVATSGPAARCEPATDKVQKTPAKEKSAGTARDDLDHRPTKAAGNRHGFKTHEFVVYPAHGVGQIVAIEEQEVAGFRLELFVINFPKDKMTLRVPTSKFEAVGMRRLSDPDSAKKSLEILTGRARIKRTMWSRRAQEYEAKINSGDINSIAEVVRDLYRSEAQPEQSYSERQLYEAALDRMAREIAVVHKLVESEALKTIEAQLQKGQRRGARTDVTTASDPSEPDIDEAA